MNKDSITIFLDRDGIINEFKDSYITRWSQFKFKPHIFRFLRVCKDRDYRVIVVTNQSAIGKGLMTQNDLIGIHARMKQRIYNEGGKISHVYFCPHTTEDNCYCKKPKSGMFIEAKKNYPEIYFENSFMIGDWKDDIDAAAPLGITTCLLIDHLTDLHQCKNEPDFCISDISQAIHLVPTYFENKKQINEDECITWDNITAKDSDLSYGLYINKDGTYERHGNF